MKTTVHIAMVIVALAFPPPSLGQVPPIADSGAYTYKQPVLRNDGWEVGDLRDAGIDAARMADLVAAIRAQHLTNLHSILVVKNGKLVFEEYFAGEDERRGTSIGTVRFDHTTMHDLRSVTKSVTGTLVGIAVGSGVVHLEDQVVSLFPQHADLAAAAKGQITIRHLLTMTSGLDWDESSFPYTDSRNSETAMDQSPSSVRFVLGQDLVAEPGSRFRYCGGCTMLLAGVIRQTTGKDLDAYAEEVLFRPLGIRAFEWLHHADGLPIAASGLRLRPRDMAKIGYLYLNEGRWRGQNVLPEVWVAAAFHPQVMLDSISAYGYQWWLDLEKIGGEMTPVLVGRGNGGQRIYVVPRFDLMVVITAGNYNSPSGSRLSEQAFWQFVLPAATPPPGRRHGRGP